MADVNRRTLLERVATSRINYWSAQIVDVLTAAGFAFIGMAWYSGPPVGAPLLVLAGLFLWSFVEYGMHRWLFHGPLPGPRREHLRHHGSPRAPISTPAFAITAGATVVWALWSLAWSRGPAALLMFGIYIGYNYFALIHHLQHHYPRLLARWPLFAHQLRLHELHHRHPELHYGISSSLWDRVFGTSLQHDEVIVEQSGR